MPNFFNISCQSAEFLKRKLQVPKVEGIRFSYIRYVLSVFVLLLLSFL